MKQPHNYLHGFFFGLFLALKFGSHATKGVSSLNYKYFGALFVKHFSGIILRKIKYLFRVHYYSGETYVERTAKVSQLSPVCQTKLIFTNCCSGSHQKKETSRVLEIIF